MVAIVDTFTVWAPSPPVPTRSVTGPRMLIGAACASIDAASPDISAAVSPLARSATPKPAISAGVAAPSMISFIAQAVCSAVSACLAMSARISAGQLGVSIGQYPFEKMTGGRRACRRHHCRPADFCYSAVMAAARERISTASSRARATGSIGWLITASAFDQVPSQRSSGRPMTSSAGGQW